MTTTVARCPTCGTRNRVPAVSDGRGVPRCGNCHSILPWIAEADDTDFEAVVDRSALPVLVDVWAPWCAPCRMVTPALEHLAEARAGRLKLVKVNADGSPGTSRRFSVQAIPTLLVVHHGRLVSRQVGAAGEERLGAWLDEALADLEVPEQAGH